MNTNYSFNAGDGNKSKRGAKKAAHRAEHRRLRHSEREEIQGALEIEAAEPVWAFANEGAA